MKRPGLVFPLLLALLAGSAPSAYADRGKMARELAEMVFKRWGAKAASGGTAALTRRIGVAATRHGDDVFNAVRRIGPRALSLADDAAAHAPRAMRLIAKHGDDAAAVLTKRSMKLLSLGDDAAEMLVKHKGVSAPLLEMFGNSATRALKKVSPQNGRRIAMLTDNLLRAKRAKDVMEVIGKYGDPAVDWIWKNKAPLAASAAMAAFLANPEPFINGTRKLTETVAKEVVVPVSSAVINGGVKVADSMVASTVRPLVAEVSREAARNVPWARVVMLTVVVIGGLAVVTVRRLLPPRRVVTAVPVGHSPAPG